MFGKVCKVATIVLLVWISVSINKDRNVKTVLGDGAGLLVLGVVDETAGKKYPLDKGDYSYMRFDENGALIVKIQEEK